MYRGKEAHLNNQTVVFGQLEGPSVKYPPGVHKHNISCYLPKNLPGSLKSKNGEIKYRVRVVLEVPWGRDIKAEQSFDVETVVDLNATHSNKLRVQLEEQKTFWSMNCGGQGADVCASIPRGGFVSGQEIQVSCSIENKSNVRFTGINMRLKSKVKCTSDYPKEKTRETSQKLKELKHSLEGETRNTVTLYTGNLTVPQCPASNHYSHIIKSDYYVKVVFRVAGPHKNVVLRLPVEIGTVPLEGVPQESSTKASESKEALVEAGE